MRNSLILIIGCFLAQFSWGQEESVALQSELWGDYYFINQNYSKASAFYRSCASELSLAQQRNFAQAYLFIKDYQKAVTIYEPVANSEEATVIDYYRFADLLLGQTALANEYRSKAYRLPWITPTLYEQDSLLYKKRFGRKIYQINNVKGNSEDNEYGLIFKTNEMRSDVFFLSDQEVTRASLRGLRRFKSEYPLYNFYKAQLEISSNELTQIKALPTSVNTLFQEGSGSYDPIRNTLYFTRSNAQLDKNKTAQLSVYSIQEDQIDQQRLALPLPFNVSANSTLHPAISPTGKRLFFSSDRPGGYGGMDLYYVEVKEGGYSKPVNLGPDINSPADEVFPYVFKEGWLFYSSNKKEGVGNLDVYLAQHRIEKRWETFILGEGINTSADDFSFGLNEELSLGYFSSNRSDGQGGDDLYTFSFDPEIVGVPDNYTYSPADTLVVAVQSVLVNDNEKMNNTDPLQRILPKMAVLETKPKNGDIIFNTNGSFWYKNRRPLIEKDSFAYRITTSKGDSDPIWVMLKRSAIETQELSKELKFTFASIFFDYGESKILVDFIDRANKVVEVMNSNPEMQIEVSSYTDCRGSVAFNLRLSEQRSQEIINYVQSKISRPERIFGAGYGESNQYDKPYQLIAGSFNVLQNAEALMLQLKQDGFLSSRITQVGKKFRVIASEASTEENLFSDQKRLLENNISGWIIENDCEDLSEEVHLQNRRTDFKVIKR